MRTISDMRMTAAVLLAAAAFAPAAGAAAQRPQTTQTLPARPTPPGWHYEIRNGKRVPRPNRVTNLDGSRREEIRQGNCVTVKERSAAGEYKETRECDGS